MIVQKLELEVVQNMQDTELTKLPVCLEASDICWEIVELIWQSSMPIQKLFCYLFDPTGTFPGVFVLVTQKIVEVHDSTVYLRETQHRAPKASAIRLKDRR